MIEAQEQVLHAEEEQKELTPEEVAQLLDAIGKSVIELRSDAINGRAMSGIEDIWREDEEFYQGIDEYNREGDGNWDTKPAGQDDLNQKQMGSTVFLNITGPYCDIASARMGDMLLPTDDRAFSVGNTPLPDLVKMAEGEIPDELLAQAQEHEAQQNPGTKPNPQKTAQSLVEQAAAALEEAEEKAKNAETKIDDWLVECQYHAEVRTVIEDIGKVGSGVLKGPIPEVRRSIAFKDGELIIDESIEPCSRRVDYWNAYPDPSCGNNIHDGSFFWEKDEITSKKLRQLKGSGQYFDYQIDRVLQQGPMEATGKIDDKDTFEYRGLTEGKSKNSYQIWYFHGTLLAEDVELLDLELDEGMDAIDVKITMVNNIVIQLDRNYLDTGEFPYDIMVWKGRKRSPFGVGVSRLLRTAQRIINAAARSLMDNAGIASGPMWLANQGLIRPINDVWEIAPLKGWMWDEDADAGMDDVRKAFTFFNVDMRQQDLQAIITLGLNMAEQVTGIPLILQGHVGSSPDTVGGMQMLQNNASTTLRRIARLFDDLITEPHIRRYYAYLLQYGPDNCKGDFQIDARGSSALIERDIQNQSIMQLGSLVQNPSFGIDPKKWIRELLKSQRLDVKNFEFDDEEWKQIVEQMSQPQQAADPRLEVEQMRQQTAQAKMQSENELAQTEMQFKADQAERDRQLKMFFEQVRAEDNKLIEAGKQQLTAAQIEAKYQEHQEKVQSDMAQTMLKLDVQEKLSREKSLPDAPQVVTPPTEPAGRAPNGMAYQR